jgi:hypothetical protein
VDIRGVKLKLPVWALILGALGSFLVSTAGWLPASVVESWYSRHLFPIVSSMLAPVADAAGFAWLDLLLPLALVLVIYLIRMRRWQYLGALVASAYLFFFWTWGLNYHRLPLVAKLEFSEQRVNSEAVSRLVEEAAGELNSLYGSKVAVSMEDEAFRREAAARIASVTRKLEGIEWNSASRIKTSLLLNPFFRAGGTLGMFNPFAHEALVTDGLLPFEQPMTALHELAHVRGYTDEGDASFIALMGAVNSPDPAFRYSGWLALWQYLASRERNELLDAGPRADLDAIAARRRQDEIRWVRRTGTRALDVYLRANRVAEGVRSYSRMVTLAVGTRPSWNRFADP